MVQQKTQNPGTLDHPQLTGAILAGGYSRRLGQDKATLPLLGKPLVRWVAEALAPMAAECWLITNHPRDHLPLGLPLVTDLWPFQGPAGGLLTALFYARTPWVLAAAVDNPFLAPELVAELARWQPAPAVAAYMAAFKYCVGGRRLRASLYPPRAVLFRPTMCRYQPDGHTQSLKINGVTALLAGWIDHDDRKPLSAWFSAQDRYASLEARKLLAADDGTLPLQDRLRKWIVPAPFVIFFYTLLIKGLIVEGWAGWFYVLQRTLAEIVLSLRLLQQRLDARA